MASGRLIDYLGQGNLSDRPDTPDLAPGGLGFYYATDESTLYTYSNNGWEVVTSAASGVSTIVPGTGILVDDSDPENPEVSVDTAALDFVESLVAGTGITVDNTDPKNPVISASGGSGLGDVVGPASAANNSIAVFDGTTGKLIKDGGLTVADLYFDTISAPAISAGTVTLNCNGGRVRNFTVLMTANATLAVSDLAPAGRVTEFECLITQDATGARTLTLPAAFRPLGGSDTAIAAAAGAKTVLSAKTFDAGTTWLYAMQEVG